MLAISRKIGQKLFIGDSIVIQIVEIYPNRVKLAIEAPRKLNIVREEVRGRERMEGEEPC